MTKLRFASRRATRQYLHLSAGFASDDRGMIVAGSKGRWEEQWEGRWESFVCRTPSAAALIRPPPLPMTAPRQRPQQEPEQNARREGRKKERKKGRIC